MNVEKNAKLAAGYLKVKILIQFVKTSLSYSYPYERSTKPITVKFQRVPLALRSKNRNK